ncbi:MAG: 3-deoxy-manno-octulosonate cytidylyltransferase [Oligoflexia bacterium]|nr:3-deoxy-manno-octulosonate cytidylyltransferase [Oligoflexia bacterium]
MSSKVAVVIPARYASSRFPGKPLVKIAGRAMIEHVYYGCSGSKYNPRVIIATDDNRIFDFCKLFIHGKDSVVMTPDDISTGSERVAWVARETVTEDFVLNVQGDEPLLTGKILDTLIDETLLCDEKNPVATLAKRCNFDTEKEAFKNPNVVKLVVSGDNRALYFSRAPIPGSKNGMAQEYLRHVGLYGFRKDFLQEFASMKAAPLEKCEGLEQLRVLENGYGIRVGFIEEELVGVDTPGDADLVETILRGRKG